jgi:hypothetical protein
MRPGGQRTGGVHPHHASAEVLHFEAQLRQRICHHTVLLEAVATAAPVYELVGERGGAEVNDGDTHQRVEVLERDRAVVGGDERVQHLDSRLRRTCVADAAEVGGQLSHGKHPATSTAVEVNPVEQSKPWQPI